MGWEEGGTVAGKNTHALQASKRPREGEADEGGQVPRGGEGGKEEENIPHPPRPPSPRGEGGGGGGGDSAAAPQVLKAKRNGDTFVRKRLEIVVSFCGLHRN